MNKNIILLGSLILSSAAYSQVGIDTDTPKATLDIKASPSISTRIDGFIAPRLKGSELKAKDGLYTTAQDGTIVYVTEAVSGVTDKTTNVTSIGYYYFDKTVSTAGRWMKIANPTAVGAYKEPWNQAGTPTPADANNQAIYQNGAVSIWRDKVFVSTASNSAKVDLHVNGATRVGGQDPDVAKSVGGNSFAGGNAPVASGNNSMAYGTSVEASGTNSAAFGNNSKAVGTESIAMGNNTTATGAQSFAGGSNGSTATGQYAFAFGNNAQAKANHAVAMGVGTVAPARSSATFGRYNVNTFTSPDIALNSPGDPIFQVGSGPDDARRYNIITTFLGTNGTTGVGGGWMAIGGDLNTMPVKVQDETLRVYGGALANKAYVTDINSVTGTATDKIVVADGTTGQLKTIAASTVAPTVTADNGLTKTANNVQLGGNLTKPTSIGTNGTVTLALTGLENTGTTSDKIIVSSTDGVLKTINASSLPNATYQEPWNQAGTTTPATANNQAIFQNGAVSIWRNKVFESTASGSAKVDLHVNGATRIGATDPAVTKKVGASSFAGGNAAVASGDNSMAYGTSVEAIGSSSIAMGNGSKVETNQSFAGGTGSTVTYSVDNTGDNSIAFGEVAQAVAASSAAFGKKTIAGGEQSLAFGNNAWATGDYSLAGGQGTKAIGNNSVAFGNGSLAQGKNSFAFTDGPVNQGAVGDYSFAFGNRASTRYNHGVAMGIGTVSPVRSGVTFGRFNSYTGATQVDGTPGGSNDYNSPGDPIFQVGQGGDDKGRSNIITGFSGTSTGNAYAPGWVVIGSQTTSATIGGINLFLSPRIGSSATLSVYGDYASNGKMDIVGAMRANGGFYSSGSQTIYPDYVFENYADKKSNINPTYKMMSLSEVDLFIKTNKHLPGVTGINELPTNENGHKEFELSKLSTQTLEKVEELYLHTIEQQKQIDELKDIVKQQQKQIDQLLKK